jgi:uncharacterized alkaline shock family protein YloU
MTDVTSEVPGPRQHEGGTPAPATASPPAPDAPAPADSPAALAASTVDERGALDRGREAAERVALVSGRVASAVVDRLRNNAELAADRGRTTIADEVAEKIVGIAARDVPGVYDLGGDVARVFAAVRQRIGLGEAGEDTDRGVKVRLEGDTAAVDITLVIEYGFVIHSVTEKVRSKVINAVENMLGLEVTEVNIYVDDVHVADDGPVRDDEE